MWLEAAHIGRCKTLGHFCPYSHTPRKCLICTLLLTNLYLLLHLSLSVSIFLFFFLTQSSHAFDFSFQTLFLRVTHNAKKRDRETSPASNQTPWPWPCPLFCLTAQSQADTRCFPLSQAEKRGVALDLWLEIRSTALSPSPTDHMMQLLNLTLEFPRTCKDCRIPRSSREHSPEIPVAPEL